MILCALALLQINVLILIAIIKVPPGIGVTIDISPIININRETSDTNKFIIFVMVLVVELKNPTIMDSINKYFSHYAGLYCDYSLLKITL